MNPAYIAEACAMINLELRACGVMAVAEPLHDGAQVTSYLVRSAFGVPPAKIKALSAAIAARCRAESCTIHQRALGLVVMLPKAPGFRRNLSPRELEAAIIRERRTVRRSAVPLGLDVTGGVVWLDLADPRVVHLIVLGLTGSGKSTLLQWLAYRLCTQNTPEHLGLLAISPKTGDFEALAGAPHLLHPPVSATRETAALLTWLSGEVDRRNAGTPGRPAIVAIVDEVPALVDAEPAIGDALDHVGRIGRSTGVHLVAGSQRADQAAIGRLIFNMPARAIGRLGSSAFNWVTTGKSGSEADTLLGSGDFLLASIEGLTRFQAPAIGGREWGQLERGYGRTLDLPLAVPMTAPAAASPNATALDDEALLQIMLAFQQGESIRAVMRRFALGFDRARKLQALAAEYAGTEVNA